MERQSIILWIGITVVASGNVLILFMFLILKLVFSLKKQRRYSHSFAHFGWTFFSSFIWLCLCVTACVVHETHFQNKTESRFRLRPRLALSICEIIRWRFFVWVWRNNDDDGGNIEQDVKKNDKEKRTNIVYIILDLFFSWCGLFTVLSEHWTAFLMFAFFFSVCCVLIEFYIPAYSNTIYHLCFPILDLCSRWTKNHHDFFILYKLIL